MQEVRKNLQKILDEADNLKIGSYETNRNDLASLPIKVNDRLNKLLIGADVIKNKDYKDIDYLVDKLIPKSTLCALLEKVIQVKFSLRQLAVSVAYGDDDFLGFKLNDSCRNVVYVSTEDNEMATSVWLNTYFGDDVAQDDKLSKLKFVTVLTAL